MDVHNCRSGATKCILGGKCLTSNVIYKCTVTSKNNIKEYIDLTANSFKQRFTAHKATSTHEKQAGHTALAGHIWNLKSNDIPFNTTWSILKQAPPYSKETKSCQLCLTEKTYISIADSNLSLNKRNEILSKCRHRDKFLLKNW